MQSLDGVGNALDFRLKRLRDQYDLSQDAQRLQYVKEAVEMLAERSNPTEQEVDAGRLGSKEFAYLGNSFNAMSDKLKNQFERIYKEELALRDLDGQPLTRENYDALMARIDAYLSEFDEHGTDRVTVDLDEG